MFFNKKNKTDLKSFLSELKTGNDNVLDILELKPSSFKKVPHSEIIDNPSDIGTGVVNVQTKFNTTFFNIFDSMLIKDYDNGDRTYIFYCTSQNHNKLSESIETFIDILGNGITNTDNHIPIDDKRTLKQFTTEDFGSEQKDMVCTWLLNNLTVLLQYRSNPKNEFSIFVTSKKEKLRDKTVKSKGTVLDLLNTDITQLFLNEEDSHESEPSSDGSTTMNKYRYTLDPKELGIFDQITIQQTGENKDFSFGRTTNITFHCSNEIDYIDKINTVEKLIRLYGSDNASYEELELHEIEMIENLEFWTGRNWTLNDKHQLWDSDNEEENIVYNVDIGYDSFEIGFNLCIISYGKLVEYFKAD
ncbi:MAG: hypothetical protein HRT71_03215 [Flavobacteriales bacterium]|nr:hypothetical protein [Flavobacteriales bacterium]